MFLAVNENIQCKPERVSAIWNGKEINARNSGDFLNWAENECKYQVPQMTIDLGNVEYINAAGLTALVRLYRFAADRGIPLRLLNLDPNVAMLLRLTGLDRIIETA